ncbi:MAG: PHP domain-containing protein [Mycobacteriales bacterium]
MRDPVADLRRIAWLLERAQKGTYQPRAYRAAAHALEGLSGTEIRDRDKANTLTELEGVGSSTATVVAESLAGVIPARLAETEAIPQPETTPAGRALRAELKGDLHLHSDWSDGHGTIEEMVAALRELGHEYAALTDHSPRLRVARGLSGDRLRAQIDLIAELNERVAPFRLLTAIEVDILEDGKLDQSKELLDRLDLVVASVHSKLRMGSDDMTRRMITAVANPNVDVLGHCTGRRTMGERQRPPSSFDADMVFAACERFGVAVEINSQPARSDPPEPLLELAIDYGCRVSIDTDAHSPGELDWQRRGAEKAAACGVPADRIVNTWSLSRLRDWTGR